MKKECLLVVFYACVITFVSASSNAAESVVQNTSKYGAEDIPVHSIVTGVYKANHNRNDTLSSDLLNTFFAINCGVIGIFLLRKAS
jgi:hypothetical protein